MVLISCSMDTLTDWYRRFIELFEALYETGYTLEYAHALPPMVRYMPVGKALDAHPMALPSDRLEIVLDQFDTFRGGQLPMPHGHGVLGAWLRQAHEKLPGHGPMGRKGHRAGLP